MERVTAPLCSFDKRKMQMALENEASKIHEDNHKEQSEIHRYRKSKWPFKTEDEEHLYFDNLQRARDARSG